MKHFVLILSLAAALYSCSDDTSCSTSADCFSGDVCSSSGVCEPAGTANVGTNGSTSNATTNSGSNTSPNATTGNNGTSGNNSTTANNGTTGNNLNPNNGGASCEVDPFTATCEDDEWEENDRVDFEESLPIDPGSWCSAGNLNSSRSFSGTFCAGDELDLFRILVDNRTPDMCLDGPFTMRIEVRILQTCNPSRIHIEPYTFFDDPVTSDLCADDENVRCTSLENGQVRVIEWLREADQLNDFYLLIGNDENNVQFDYEVELTVTP